MQRYSHNLTAQSGGYLIAAAGASVTVKDYPAGTVATIYSDDGVTPKTNPIVTGSEGDFFFYAADGRYTLEFSGGGYPEGSLVDITLDGLGDTDVDTLRADLASTASGKGAALEGFNASLTYAAGTTGRAIADLGVSAASYPFLATLDGVADDSTEIAAAATAAGIRPVVLSAASISAPSLSAVVGRLVSPNVEFSNRNENELGLPATQYPPAAAMTWAASERFVKSYRNGAVSGHSIYEAAYPSVASYDTLQGVTDIAPGSTIENASGVAGYIRHRDTAPANGVCLFGCGSAEVSNASIWGVNTLLTDNNERAVDTLTGITLVGSELDFNVMCPGTTLIGSSVGGNSLSQPTLAQGYIVNSLGTGIKWTKGFVTIDGAVDSSTGAAYVVGADAASGANVASQRMLWNWRDGAAASQAMTMQFGSGFFTIGNTGSWNGLNLSSGSYWCATGQGLIVNGSRVASDRITGYSAMTGANDKATVYDTGTITLAQLAGRVMQMQLDLTTHGMIGT